MSNFRESGGQRGKRDNSSHSICILFLIRALNQGGAERQLVLLAKELMKRGHRISVAVFYGGGIFEDELRSAGVEVISLGKRGRWDVLLFLINFIRTVRNIQPDVVHSYLVGSNIVTSIIKMIFPRTSIIWGLRSSNEIYSQYDWMRVFTGWLEVQFSRVPNLIIANSFAGLKAAADRGMRREKIRVVHNGIDTERFRPDPAAGKKIRAELGIAEHEQAIGIVGRLDPKKDHLTFLNAAAVIARERQDIKFVCVGGGPSKYRDELISNSEQLGLSEKVIWAGGRLDMNGVYNAFDVHCSSSAWGEGFPNVIGEAMACGLSCVATDVGDSARIIDDLGVIVPPGDAEKLATGLKAGLEMQKENVDGALRERIIAKYSIIQLANRTEKLLLDCVSLI